MKTEKNSNSSVLSVLSFSAEQVLRLARENPVFGQPVVQQGRTVIPISKVSVGFAGGGADRADPNEKPGRLTPAGGGGKATLTPVSVLVIDGENKENPVQIIPAGSPQEPGLTGSIGTVLSAVKKLIHPKDKA